ncbi:hypothetical protein [Streptomyces sp. NPDC056192]|uniref:hypothetical protein n=1 Tax=Streptomyces sp. NPDC056192 TaxID=3345743 RepID=UPI0035DB07DA
MLVKQINLDDDGQPETLLVRLTRNEAAYLALLTGKQSGHTSGDIMPGGDSLNSEVYEALTGEFFNRYYEDGVHGSVSRAETS